MEAQFVLAFVFWFVIAAGVVLMGTMRPRRTPAALQDISAPRPATPSLRNTTSTVLNRLAALSEL